MTHPQMTDALPPRIVELLHPATGGISLAARHVEGGRAWRHEAHRRVPSASLIKLPILAAFWEAAEAGACPWPPSRGGPSASTAR